MSDLPIYIEHLLLTHDCVVLPQFGAFITLAVPASRVEEEALFLPPKRMVRFTPDVTQDDGLLVDTIARYRHISTSDAKRAVQQLILDLRQQLLADGQVDFGSLGVLSQNEDGQLDFAPCLAGVVTPAFFALDGFTFPLLSSLQRSKTARRRIRQASDDTHITIRISRRALRYTAMIAAMIVACLLIMGPAQLPTPAPSTQQASIISYDKATQVATESTEKTKGVESTKGTETPAVSDAPAVSGTPAVSEATVAVEAPEKAAPAVQKATPYVVVLASAISQKNAETFVSKLHDKGYTNAEIMFNGKMRRVVLTGYQSETEAYTEAVYLHHQSRELETAWVMQLPSTPLHP